MSQESYRDMIGYSAHVPNVQHNHSLQRDPTQTTMLRKRFAEWLRGRYDDIRAALLRGVRDRDILGIAPEGITPDMSDTDSRVSVPPDLSNLSPDGKIERLSQWLEDALQTHLLDRGDQDIRRFARQAYKSGLRQADTKLAAGGAPIDGLIVGMPDARDDADSVLARELHQEELGVIEQRVFTELEGINDATAQQIERELIEGIQNGENPREIARRMSDRIEKIGKTRATTMARTEIVNANNVGALERYDEAGVGDFEIAAEYLTAEDSRVCPICKPWNGEIISKSEALALLPQHPNCRCSVAPVIPDRLQERAQSGGVL